MGSYSPGSVSRWRAPPGRCSPACTPGTRASIPTPLRSRTPTRICLPRGSSRARASMTWMPSWPPSKAGSPRTPSCPTISSRACTPGPPWSRTWRWSTITPRAVSLMPVAPHPPVLAPGMSENARGVIVDPLHVRDQGGPGVQALEEIVGQEGVLGDPAFEGGYEGVHVIEALAREDPLGKQILVGVRDRRRVGIDARVPGIHAGEQRPGGARHRHADS